MADLVRDHHKKILAVLRNMDADKLRSMQCLFGGGTAISLLINEFRTSVDIDFLCSSHNGYAELRGLIYDHGLNPLFRHDMPELARDVRADRDGIRTVLLVDGIPIKLEIVQEARINLSEGESWLPVPTLSKTNLFAEKLLCNTDRGADPSTMGKDIIDLLVMENAWGPDRESLAIAMDAYRSGVMESYSSAVRRLHSDKKFQSRCFDNCDLDNTYREIVSAMLTRKSTELSITH